MKDMALVVAAIIFLLVSAMHLARLFLKVKVSVNNFVLPMWLSAFGFVFALCLGLWMLKAAR